MTKFHAFDQRLFRIAYRQRIMWIADKHCLDARLLGREVVCSLKGRDQVVIIVLVRWCLGNDHVDVCSSFEYWPKAV